jgi:hypothetical protein
MPMIAITTSSSTNVKPVRIAHDAADRVVRRDALQSDALQSIG